MRLWVMEEGDGEPDGTNPFQEDHDDVADIDSEDDNNNQIHFLPENNGWDEPALLPPAPIPPNRNNGPPNVRFNRRIQQGLLRLGPVDDNNNNNNRDGLQRFLAMAAADEEDGWDSDELNELDALDDLDALLAQLDQM